MPTVVETTEGVRALRAMHDRGFRQFGLDSLAWATAIVAAVVFRYDFEPPATVWFSLVGTILLATTLQYVAGWVFHLYRARYAYGSFEEVRALGLGVALAAGILAIPLLIFSAPLQVPRSTIFIAAPIAFVLMVSVRYLRRLLTERGLRPGDDAQATVIYGAGYLGTRLVRDLSDDTESPLRIVGLLDDDPTKRNLQIRNVRVLGSLADLPSIVENTGATALIVAIARADAELMRRVQDAASLVDVQVKVMPSLAEILSDTRRATDIRDISIEDLIGRQPIDTQVESIAGYLRGKRVLVTGAGGSIGSELCRQIVEFSPAELIMLDRDETGLQTAQIGTSGHGLLDSKDVVLADIREIETLLSIFEERKPEVVFHAAALKHLPMLEQYPDEAWKTNVLGTLNVLEASRAAGVATFINISTDKAANPTSVLGHSKRLAEKLTADASRRTGLRYLSVRFGNVIGSRGSMLPTFQSLIQSGGPLTVTHPDVTRYFMTIPEACQLVVQAGGIGRPGEVLILDMGEPVRILDIAQRMIDMSGKDIEVVFTGLRDGEKLHEELVGSRERLERPFHPKVSHAVVDPLDPQRLDKEEWERRMFGTPRVNDTGIVASLPSGRGVPE